VPILAVSALKPYREVPLDEVEKALKRQKQKGCDVFPEPTFHADITICRALPQIMENAA
jgi:hypothetical protein